MRVVHDLPRPIREIENLWIPLAEGDRMAARVNGRSITGAAFPNDVWRPWFDRPLSSALVALAEVFREAAS